MHQRPNSVYLTSEQFDWLVDLLARHHEGRRHLRWLQENVRPQGEGFLLAPPDGDFKPVLTAFASIGETLAGANEIVLVYQYLEAADGGDEIVAQRMLANLEEVMEDMQAEADRLDILQNIVFYRVNPEHAE